jgi:hypothetical protein
MQFLQRKGVWASRDGIRWGSDQEINGELIEVKSLVRPGQVWWWTLVIPATWEVDTGG